MNFWNSNINDKRATKIKKKVFQFSSNFSENEFQLLYLNDVFSRF